MKKIISIISLSLLLVSFVIARETGDAFFNNLSVSGTATIADNSITELTSSTATITNTLTAGTLTDGTASITAGAGSGFTTFTASTATITNTLSSEVIDFAVNLDTTTAPGSTGIVGLTSEFKMYVSTGTSAGSWELIGSQS